MKQKTTNKLPFYLLNQFNKTFRPNKIKITDHVIQETYKRLDLKEVKVIFDIGSRDGRESIEFAKRFPNAKIYAVECNPIMIPIITEATKDYPQIEVIPKAINTYDGTCKFFPINVDHPSKGNVGASSLFKSTDIESFDQKEVEVPCFKIETFCKENNIDAIDVVWMDLQGAELLALKSFGDLLNTVQILQTEVEFVPLYEGQDMFDDIHFFLHKFGFRLFEPDRIPKIRYKDTFGDVIYMQSKYIL